MDSTTGTVTGQLSHRGRVSEGSGGREECKEKRGDSALESLEHLLSIRRDEMQPAKTQEKATLGMPWRMYKANGDLSESHLNGGWEAEARL